MLRHPLTHVRAGRYRTRTAAEATAACGGNREPRLGPRSDFSKPCQGAAEKSANATRTGASRQIPSRFPTHRNVYQERCRPTHSVWGFFVVTGQECKRAKAGYHRGDGILPFVFIQIDSTESQIGQTTKNAVSANIFQKGLTFSGSSI